MSAKIQENSVVGLVYDLWDNSGVLLEKRTPENPFYFIIGAGQILPAIEKVIRGQTVGYKISLELDPKSAYGEYNPALKTSMSRSGFPKSLPLKVGMRFDTTGPDGQPIVVEITGLNDEMVEIDGNHPLAGVSLRFELLIHSVRKATEQELESGSVQTMQAERLH